MDHSLRTISYIADIGDLVVIMARRRLLPQVWMKKLAQKIRIRNIGSRGLPILAEKRVGGATVQPLLAKGHERGFFQISYHFTLYTRDGLLRPVFDA